MILKQPDVVMLNYLLPDEFSDDVKAANYAFYEKRTMHKSSLSLRSIRSWGSRWATIQWRSFILIALPLSI